ncbi:hypothetical protein ACET3Z_014421 [Daucus carota]
MNNGRNIEKQRARNEQWKEVRYIKLEETQKIQEEVEKYKDLMEEEILRAIRLNSNNIIRYAYNRLERIKRLVDQETLNKVEEGDEAAMEAALEKLMECSWEGPIVKFADTNLQRRLEEGESIHRNFILQSERWVDENVIKMVKEGCNEGLRMASNQTHYKSLRNMESGKSYQEALTGRNPIQKKEEAQEDGWTTVRRKKKPSKTTSRHVNTIFVSNIPIQATAKELWQFFNKKRQVKDIILPKKRDKLNRRYGFVKVRQEQDVNDIMQGLKYEVFYSQPLVLQPARERGLPVHSEPNKPINKANQRGREYNKVEPPFSPAPKGGPQGDPKPARKEEKKGGQKVEEEIIKISPCKDIESIANKSMVCFSDFPLNGDILQEVLVELGYVGIIVKEVSCYKFIFSFNSKKSRDDFNFENLSDWVSHPRPMENEDYRIARKIVVEIRGLPCNTWKEENLKKIVKNTGTWGWWLNNPMYHSSLENPLVTVYTESLSRVSKVVRVQMEGISRQIMINELENSVHYQEERNTERESCKHREGKEKVSREGKERMSKTDPNPKTYGVDDQREEEANVFEEQGTKIVKEGNGRLMQTKLYRKIEEKPTLEVSNSVDAESDKEDLGRERVDSVFKSEEEDNIDPSINTGDLFVLDTNIQNSICNVLKKINIDRTKKKRRQGCRTNPFDIGRCKLSRYNRRNGNNQPKPTPRTLVKKKDLEQEALEIVQMAEDMGLQLKTSKEDAIKKIKEQLSCSQI